MDLRYQSPHRPWGFYGMKDGILLRSPSNTEHVPDWDFYDNQDRYKIIQEQVQHKTVNTHWQYLRKINILTFEVNLEYSRALQWRCNNLPLYKTTWPDWDFYDNQDRYKIIQEQVQHKTVNTHWQSLRKINILTFEVNLEYNDVLIIYHYTKQLEIIYTWKYT